MRVTVECRVNAHSVEIRTPLHTQFTKDGVSVELTAHVPDGRAFASITCSGAIEVSDDNQAQPTRQSATPWSLIRAGNREFMSRQAIDDVPATAISNAVAQVDAVLQQAGSMLRWRFGMAGRDTVLADVSVQLLLDDGQLVALEPLGQVDVGDDLAAVREPDWATLADWLESGNHEPIAHQLLREAWNLRHSNPRSSLVIGVAAAEVGLKQLVTSLVPATRSLVEHLPPPPLVKTVRHTLSELPIRANVAPDRRCPIALRKLLDEAVQDRNSVVHRGLEPRAYVHTTLVGIREFLYLLDFYDGHRWAASQLSDTSRTYLGIES